MVIIEYNILNVLWLEKCRRESQTKETKEKLSNKRELAAKVHTF